MRAITIPKKIEAKLKQIQAQYPKLTQLLTIGKSIQNRPIFALVLSTTPNVDQAAFHQKPTVLFDAMHHAREIMTPEVVMDIAESLLTGAQKGAGTSPRGFNSNERGRRSNVECRRELDRLGLRQYVA
jgi:murein tripeptide amidase MpaA